MMIIHPAITYHLSGPQVIQRKVNKVEGRKKFKSNYYTADHGTNGIYVAQVYFKNDKDLSRFLNWWTGKGTISEDKEK